LDKEATGDSSVTALLAEIKRLRQENEALHKELAETRAAFGAVRREAVTLRADLDAGDQGARPVADCSGARDALRPSEATLQQIVDLCPFPIFAKNVEGRFLFVNRVVAEAFDLTVEEVTGRLQAELHHEPAQLEAMLAHDRLVIEGAKAMTIPEECFTGPDGVEHWFLTFKVPFQAVGSGEPAVLALSIDITERRRAEARQRELENILFRAQKQESLGVLAGGVAHDFNNILTGVLGWLDAATEALSATSDARHCLDEARCCAQRAAEVAHQMLTYSGQGSFDIQTVRLDLLVNGMLKLLRAGLSNKVILRTDHCADQQSFPGDAAQIRQVVMNLVTNAVEALADEQGVVTVATGVMSCDRAFLECTEEAARLGVDGAPGPGTYAFIEVRDTGLGMDEVTRSKVYDPFFTTKFPGRGLGLAAVLGIVRGHRGTIRVTTRPNAGTTFRVLFPVPPPGTPAPTDLAGPEAAVPWVPGSKILLAEDDEAVVAVVRLILEQFGFDVLVARNGREVIRLVSLHRQELSCLILDAMLPEADGVAVLQGLRRLAPEAKIVVTSGLDEQQVAIGMSVKARSAFIKKPYDRETLRETLRSVLTDSSLDG
jgi:PAS domain S-box-containing protein